MRHISLEAAVGGGAAAYPNTGRKPRSRRHQPRDRYADAGRSAREALDRLRVAEREARADGRTVPPSCARVLLEIVGHLTTWSRRNYEVSIRSIEEGTGLARSTVRRALTLLEGYGCIVRITPENTPGITTPPTIIALPVVEVVHEDEPADLADPDREGWAPPVAPTRTRSLEHLDSTPPVAPRCTRPLEHPDAPPTRSNEREVRGRVRESVPPGRSPVGRSSDRPPTSPVGSDTPAPARRVSREAAQAADQRIREAVRTSSGLDPADIRLVDAYARQERHDQQADALAALRTDDEIPF